jgi:hypothetical protein
VDLTFRVARANHRRLKAVFTGGYAPPALAKPGLSNRGVRPLPNPLWIEAFARTLRATPDGG